MHCQFWLPFFFWFLIVMIKWRTHWRIWKYTREGCFTLATTAASLTALWVKIPYLPSLKRLLGSWGKTIQMATASIVYGRRSSATTAADNGATVAQMMDFYGWAQPSMPQEYISSSKHAVKCMAEKLKGSSDCSTSSTDDPNINTLRPQENSIPGGVNKFVYIEHFSGTFNL